MNERIKSLLAKAHLDVMEDLGDIDTNQVAERFAELIVKECAYLVNDQQRTTGYTTHAKMLCEQFGIEFKEEDYWGRE